MWWRNLVFVGIVLFIPAVLMATGGTIRLSQAKEEYTKLLVAKNGGESVTGLVMIAKWRREEFASQKDWEDFIVFCDEKAKNDSPDKYAHFCFEIGNMLDEHHYPHLAFQYYMQAENYAKDKNPKEIPYYINLHHRLGVTYYTFRSYHLAEEHFRLVLRNGGASAELEVNIFNSLALIYRNTGNPEKSRVYFEKALALAKKNNNKGWIGVIDGNLGAYYYKKGDFEKARQLMQLDYQISSQTKQWESALNALILLAEIDMRLNKMDSAVLKMKQAESFLNSHYHRKSANALLHKTWTVIHEAMNNYKEAYNHQKMHLAYIDSLQKEENFEQFNNTQFQMAFQQKQSQIQLLKSKKKRVEQLFLFSGIVVCMIIIGLFLVIRQVVLRRNKEKEVLTLQNLRIEDELRNTEEQMRLVLSNLGEKNELVSQLQSEIDQFQSLSDHITHDEKESLQDKLHSFKLLTEDDWDEFRRLFEKLNPGFLVKFMELSDTLSKADLRLAALIRLDLSYSQIGKILGISPESVKRTHLRLRKKLMIDQQKDLDDMIRSL